MTLSVSPISAAVAPADNQIRTRALREHLRLLYNGKHIERVCLR
jgi:hypothetical protein